MIIFLYTVTVDLVFSEYIVRYGNKFVVDCSNTFKLLDLKQKTNLVVFNLVFKKQNFK